jgi:hypothetical protein
VEVILGRKRHRVVDGAVEFGRVALAEVVALDDSAVSAEDLLC